MNWGKWIVVSFVLFAAFIATLVAICFRQDIGLVTDDYYKEELVFEQQMERVNNARELNSTPKISVVGQQHLKISFAYLSQLEKGSLLLFSPANAKLDKTFDLKASPENECVFYMGKIPKGMYRAKMRWTMNGKEFYTESVIFI